MGGGEKKSLEHIAEICCPSDVNSALRDKPL